VGGGTIPLPVRNLLCWDCGGIDSKIGKIMQIASSMLYEKQK